MGEPSEEKSWHEALERLGPEIVRAKPGEVPGEAQPPAAAAAAATASPEPVADPLLHGENASVEAEGSKLQSLRYWAAVAGAAGVIAAITGLLSLLPMSMR
jgi:hypothetical protein